MLIKCNHSFNFLMPFLHLAFLVVAIRNPIISYPQQIDLVRYVSIEMF